MKALVYCHGSRGDVQPYLALAHALNQAGHSATLVAPRLFAPFAAAYDVDFAGLDDWSITLWRRPEVRRLRWTSDRRTPETERRRAALKQEAMDRYPIILKDMWEAAADGADIIVHSQASREQIAQIAEKLGVPNVFAVLYPNFVVSRRYPAFGRLSDVFSDQVDESGADPYSYIPPQLITTIEQWRSQTLGLPPREGFLDFRRRADGSPTPVLHIFSPHVIPPADDWPDTVHTAGFWHLPPAPGWRPPDDLVRFLEAGEKPVFVGFGSTLSPDPQATARVVLEGVRASGQRAVVVEGWGGIQVTDYGDDILTVEDVPYAWLLPRVRAVVHAGGPGSYNDALRAGIPQVICAFETNQRMWGEHLHRLGVAPPPVMQRELTPEGLAADIRHAVTDPGIAAAAARFGTLLGAEDGLGAAVRVLEKVHAEGVRGR
ncbi:glycosyltransferase [Streptomyces huasconensis]|uniref:Glycosyltransferase n=1 Tax=Streptomyces huasconensis TaxID=1854574 RepID=A0ABV3LXF7_9ACTN